VRCVLSDNWFAIVPDRTKTPSSWLVRLDIRCLEEDVVGSSR